MEIANVKMSMHPFDEIAVEEVTRLKEKGVVTEVIAFGCCVLQWQTTLRTAMAIRAILDETTEELQPLAVAKQVKVLVDKKQIIPRAKRPWTARAGLTQQGLRPGRPRLAICPCRLTSSRASLYDFIPLPKNRLAELRIAHPGKPIGDPVGHWQRNVGIPG